MKQPELTPAAAAPVATTDRFAAYRAEHPEAKFIEFHDHRTGAKFVATIPPGSPWHALLPDEQIAHIRPAP